MAKGKQEEKGQDATRQGGGKPRQVLTFFDGRNEKPRVWLFAAVGKLLYDLGFAAQLRAVRLWRGLRDGALLVAQLAAVIFRAAGGALKRGLKKIGHDMMAPFRRFRQRRAQLQRVRQRARRRMAQNQDTQVRTFFGVGAKSTMLLLGRLAAFMMPVAAAIVLAVTVHSVLSMEYALAVEINGEVLGYVADQTVVENAKGLLRDRIKLAGNQELSDWQLNPSYTIARANRFTTTHQLANEILLSSSEDPSDLVQATGFYVDDHLFAVTTEGQRLREYLDAKLAAYEDPGQQGAAVDFVRKVECEPNDDDVFFASSVMDYDTLIEQLEAEVSAESYVQADGEQTLEQIAESNNLAVEVLLVRNPELAGEEADFVPEEGAQLVINRARTFLQVQVSFRTKSVEAIPYEVVENESAERVRGTSVVVQEGVEGEQEVWYDYVYIDGELEGKILVEEMTVVLSEPVARIVEVGTKDPTVGDYTMPAGGYGGSYMFPVPSSPYSSRGMGSGHRGLDINAPTGEPIFACEGGVVTEAGWHYSWGYYIVIAHPGDVTTLYAHCSALYVSSGQQVSQGTHIGAVGSTGNSSGPHCHLEVAVGGQLVDPVGYVGYPY